MLRPLWVHEWKQNDHRGGLCLNGAHEWKQIETLDCQCGLGRAFRGRMNGNALFFLRASLLGAREWKSTRSAVWECPGRMWMEINRFCVSFSRTQEWKQKHRRCHVLGRKLRAPLAQLRRADGSNPSCAGSSPARGIIRTKNEWGRVRHGA